MSAAIRPTAWPAVLVLCCLLAACASREPVPPWPATAVPVARAPAVQGMPGGPADDRAASSGTGASGTVLGRNERLLIYRPAQGDTLDAIAKRFVGDAQRAWTIAELNGGARIEPGMPMLVPLKPINPMGVLADRYQTVPILCYHRLGSANSKMVVSPANFEAQLDWLARNDYRVIRLADLSGFLSGTLPLPRRSVVITFDDGYESVYRHAFPLLKKHGFAATVFVYTDFLGGGDALTWPQLLEMRASGLVEVQSHSKSHRNLIERANGESDERYRANIEGEMRVPRDLLERRLAPARVRHLAYPFGDANEVVLESAARNGFELAATVNPGGNPFFAQPLMLRRTMIFGDMSLDAFKAKLQTSRALSTP